MEAHDANPLRAGDLVGGKYRILAPVGEGGMAQVYEAVHVGLETSVAVKVLGARYARQQGFIERFGREARATATITSPHVAKVLDVGTLDDGRPFLVMELLIGVTLAELVSRGPLPIWEAADLVQQAARGIEAAHVAGIVHRDIKPENLFACDLGPLAQQRRLVKVVDFGIAKDVRERASRITQPGEVMGSVMYMSPEQIKSSSSVDRRSDVWALGVVLYELLAGAPPFEGDNHEVLAKILTEAPRPLRSIRPDVPPELEAVVARAMEKDPSKRFQSAHELAEALATFAPAEPAGALAARLPPDSVPRVRSSPSLVTTSVRQNARTAHGWDTSGRQVISSRTSTVVGVVSGAMLLVGLVLGFVAIRERSTQSPARTGSAMNESSAPVAPPSVGAASSAVIELPESTDATAAASEPAPTATASAEPPKARAKSPPPRSTSTRPASKSGALPRRF